MKKGFTLIELLTVGIAISAIIPKIKITANNSIKVNPFFIPSPILNYIIYVFFCKLKKLH